MPPSKIWICLFFLSFRCTHPFGPREAVVEEANYPSLLALDLSQVDDLNDLPDGWYHKTFSKVTPMTMFKVTNKQDQKRFVSKGGRSKLIRQLNVSTKNFPYIKWSWKVEKGLALPEGKGLSASNDSPAKIFLKFASDDKEQPRSLELIWDSKGKPGSIKRIEGSKQYVVRSQRRYEGRWHTETVHIPTVYRKFFGKDTNFPPRLTHIAIECDSDQTDQHTISYFSNIILKRNSDSPIPVSSLDQRWIGQSNPSKEDKNSSP